ncbi:HEAT repeat domain-containing protein [Aquirhabdus parva]|uniref:HEAT repeat domain-containing protein n=1 Tax=Aquirhabdus parva TaxID=2283318 RepID=A0A345P3A8_9GAMM|nr:hypothetical protein [Aquirhabdus parva]AXI01767.1 hypothetical protein HYN46_02050 [Aquirhabdus parva]
MKNYNLTQLLCSSGLCFLIGAGISWFIVSAPPPTPETAIETTAMDSPKQQTPENKFHKSEQVTITHDGAPTPTPAKIIDPTAQQDVFLRFERANSKEEREQIKILLLSHPSPEVQAFALRLTKSSSPEQRADGYALLQSYGFSDPDVRTQLQQALNMERDPQVLRAVIQTLHYDPALTNESQGIVSRLGQLIQNPDPAIRSSSLVQLSQWQKGAELETAVYPALNDASVDVRQAAISTLLSSDIRSDRIKNSLMQIVNNNHETPTTRDIALNALGDYTLSPQEINTVMQAKTAIGHPHESRRTVD